MLNRETLETIFDKTYFRFYSPLTPKINIIVNFKILAANKKNPLFI